MDDVCGLGHEWMNMVFGKARDGLLCRMGKRKTGMKERVWDIV